MLQVWWGRRDPQRDPLPAGVQGRIDRTVTEDRAHLARAVPFSERSLMIRGLPMDQYDLIECQAIEFALTEVFSEWVVEDTSVVPGKGYGFIRVSMRCCCCFIWLLSVRVSGSACNPAMLIMLLLPTPLSLCG